MKRIAFCSLCIIFILLVILAACYPGRMLRKWTPVEILPASVNREMKHEMLEIVGLWDANADRDTMETILANEGYSVLNTDADYPSYLENPDGIRTFWKAASSEGSAFQTVLHVREDGGFSQLCFYWEKNAGYFVRTTLNRDDRGAMYVESSEFRPLYDIELTQSGNFYYQIYPDDPHYINYGVIRLERVDPVLYDLTQKYISPVGYRMVNLFLCDWQENNWGELSFSDLFEYCYEMNTGSPLSWDNFSFQHNPTRAKIPAQLFENTICPYFDISLTEFRNRCRFIETEDCYFWRPVHGNDLTVWEYPVFDPQVVSYKENSEKTMILTVQVASAEKKTDCLFRHEVTIRLLEENQFQYVANRVTYVGEWGIPYSESRFSLDE